VWRGRTSGDGRGIIRAFAAGPEFVEQKRARFVRDLYLSMAGSVETSNRKTISEPHMRAS
jgi:hypothetical protein